MKVKVIFWFLLAFAGSCTHMHSSRIEGDLESEYILQKETARNPENFQNN